MANHQTLEDIPNVSIDPTGRFKYILIKLTHNGQEKHIVRGFQRAEYHGKLPKRYLLCEFLLIIVLTNAKPIYSTSLSDW